MISKAFRIKQGFLAIFFINFNHIFPLNDYYFETSNTDIICKISMSRELSDNDIRSVHDKLKILNSRLTEQLKHFEATDDIAQNIVDIIYDCAAGKTAYTETGLGHALSTLVSNHGKNAASNSLNFWIKKIKDLLGKQAKITILSKNWPLATIEITPFTTDIDSEFLSQREAYIKTMSHDKKIDSQSQTRALMLTKFLSTQYLFTRAVLARVATIINNDTRSPKNIEAIPRTQTFRPRSQTTVTFLFNLQNMLARQELLFSTFLSNTLDQDYERLDVISEASEPTDQELSTNNFFEMGDFRGFVATPKSPEKPKVPVTKTRSFYSTQIETCPICISPINASEDDDDDSSEAGPTTAEKEPSLLKKFLNWLTPSSRRKSGTNSRKISPEPQKTAWATPQKIAVTILPCCQKLIHKSCLDTYMASEIEKGKGLKHMKCPLCKLPLLIRDNDSRYPDPELFITQEIEAN